METSVVDHPVHSVSANEIAKYFIWKSNSAGKKITNKKLQKLLYYSQAWHLAVKGTPLFNDKIEAWIHGPAIMAVYQKYKPFGFQPIETVIAETEIRDIPDKALLDEIWKVYGKLDAQYLERLTHSEQPWIKARESIQDDAHSDEEITHEEMRIYYSSLLEKSKENEKLS